MSLTSLDAKSSTKYQQQNSTMYKNNYTPQPSGIYNKYAKMVLDLNSISVIYNINKLKKKSDRNMSIAWEKAFDKIQNQFIIKTLNKFRRELPQNEKRMCQKSTSNIILNCERLNIFPWISSTRQECLLLPHLFNMVLDVLVTAISQKKGMWGEAYRF